MNKPVTKERIDKAIERYLSSSRKAMRHYDAFFVVIGRPLSDDIFSESASRWKECHERLHVRLEMIQKIQQKAGISGLESTYMKLGDSYVHCPWEADYLALTDTDMEVMRQAKAGITEAWLNHVGPLRLDPFVFRNGAWQKFPLGSVQAALPFYDWAFVLEQGNPGDRHYEAWLRLGNGSEFDAVDCCIEFCASRLPPC